MTMKDAIKKVVAQENLSIDEASEVMELMLEGKATQSQIGAYLTALRIKSESLDEIIGSARVLSKKAEHIKLKSPHYIDFVGTGGDARNTFNISTTASFVVAGAGVVIAKHGNRAISSKSGSADLLEALGVNINKEPQEVAEAIDEIGIGFMFAQVFHKSMKNVSQARAEMGIRSIFNILGPLSNPSDAKAQLIGVFNPKLTDPFAHAMRSMSVTRGIVVCGLDGMDEVTTTTSTAVSEIKNGRIINYTITPQEFDIEVAVPEELTGGDASENALITKDILLGTKGAKRDIVVLNSAFALYVADKVESIEDGIKMAEDSIDSGKAYEKLEKLIKYSNK